MIRVLLAEDHAVVRGGLLQLLGDIEEFEVVGAASGGEEAVRLAAAHTPDVVLMDLEMPGIDGIEATRRIREADPDVNVVVLTAFSDRGRILDAIDAGAVGYLLKDAEPEDLIRGLQAAARGESPLAPKAAQALVAARADQQSDPELTPREREVLALLADGLPNKLIARRLDISEKTVKAHLTNIFQRIGVTDRTQAALWAQKHARS
ncbi:MAG TPA: response regulator transcription factor [Thermoleophilaceae bacterium]|nr:response regulator transcription factor [Thermoleophilaceae bacterium]